MSPEIVCSILHIRECAHYLEEGRCSWFYWNFERIRYYLEMFYFYYFVFNIYFIWLGQVSVAACRIFSCSMQTLSCSLQDYVPWPGTKPRTPASGARGLSHWTIREVPHLQKFWKLMPLIFFSTGLLSSVITFNIVSSAVFSHKLLV